MVMLRCAKIRSKWQRWTGGLWIVRTKDFRGAAPICKRFVHCSEKGLEHHSTSRASLWVPGTWDSYHDRKSRWGFYHVVAAQRTWWLPHVPSILDLTALALAFAQRLVGESWTMHRNARRCSGRTLLPCRCFAAIFFPIWTRTHWTRDSSFIIFIQVGFGLSCFCSDTIFQTALGSLERWAKEAAQPTSWPLIV